MEEAERQLAEFAAQWDRQYPSIGALWRRNWQGVIPFFQFPPEIRKIVYTTDEIDKPFLSDRSLFLRNRFWRPCQFSGWLRRAGLFPAGKDPLIGSLGLFGHGPFLVAN